MVCDRCILVVKNELIRLNIPFQKVELGQINFDQGLSDSDLKNLSETLIDNGFEILNSRESKFIERVKQTVIGVLHEQSIELSNENYSNLISRELGCNYSYISKLFSQTEGQTIEHYIIKQKIERTKELLTYGELTLSEIANDLNYSSSQHLSRQFKQTTGMTPSEFRMNGKRKKLDTI
ncbi:MAG: AraC family transcriptional regulator [Crocinitomicaceae bacterium]|jgi:AraC family transcriptional regulator